MCKVCESEKALISIVMENWIMKEDIKFMIFRDKIYLVEDNKLNTEMHWKINYCPICGKKLKED